MFKPTAERLAEWRSRAQSVAARDAGFAYAGYGQLKIAQIVESSGGRLATLGGLPPDAGAPGRMARHSRPWASTIRREAMAAGGAGVGLCQPSCAVSIWNSASAGCAS